MLLSVWIAFSGLCGFLATSVVCWGESDDYRAVVQADWQLQERLRGSDVTDPAALERLIRRGRLLADDLEARGAESAVRIARRTLDDMEHSSAAVREQSAAANMRAPDGFHLVGAAVGGGGVELDPDRVKGKDWTYSPSDGTRLGGLRTLSWDDQEVLYRFRGLPGGAAHRVRLVFANNARRARAVGVNGRELDRFILEDWSVTERWLEVPGESVVGGQLEVAVRTTGANNVIVSGIEIWASQPPADAALAARLEPRRAALFAQIPLRVPALQPLYYEARWAVRELALANPLLDFDSVVFVRRHWPSIGHQCAHRVGQTQRPGATLCVLTGLRGDGQVRDILGDRLPPGGIGRFDVSFDGRRIVFPYAAPREDAKPYSTGFGLVPLRFAADGGPDDADIPRGGSGNQGGSCHMYDIYEIGIDGDGLRKVAGVDYAEDTEPCYLPDGRIAFTSSRDGRLVQCGDWALVNALYAVNADGSHPRRITEPKEGEFYPSLLDDGRIIYTRWDYVMKPFNMIQQLWTVFPDGRAAELAYGDHYMFSPGPIAFFEARQVPGTSWVVSNGAAHHNTGGGPVVLVDLTRNRGGPEGMRNLTPEVGYPERGPAGMGGWFASPYPLAMEHFLVVYSMESRDDVSHGYGLYLLDAFGNLELIHRDPQMSVYSQGAYTYNNQPNLQFRFSDSYRALMPHVRIDPVGDYDGSVTPMAPYAVGSAVSPLMRLLQAGHYDVELPADDWLALACWIDCNAPFYGGWDEVEYIPHTATPTSPQQRAERRAQLGAVAYLDCGSHVSDGDRRFGPELRMETTRFAGYEGEFFTGEGPVPRWHAVHVFSRRPIRFRAHGLDPSAEYRLGVSWWDHGGQQVSQSLTVETFDGQRSFSLLSHQPLPIWPERSELPAERTAIIPREAYADGRLKIEVSAPPRQDHHAVRTMAAGKQ